MLITIFAMLFIILVVSQISSTRLQLRNHWGILFISLGSSILCLQHKDLSVREINKKIEVGE